MTAAQVDAVERTTALLTRFSLSTAAPELGQRLESAGHREALLLVLEVLEMEAEAREQRKITRLRRVAQLPPGKTFETLDASTLPAPLMRKLRDEWQVVREDCWDERCQALMDPAGKWYWDDRRAPDIPRAKAQQQGLIEAMAKSAARTVGSQVGRSVPFRSATM
jgi:hypothetical protein